MVSFLMHNRAMLLLVMTLYTGSLSVCLCQCVCTKLLYWFYQLHEILHCACIMFYLTLYLLMD
jgi:hypothetical protein